jgi:hypothetical protein
MTIVLRPGDSIDDLVAGGSRLCPSCGGGLRRWGQARWRVVRGPAAGGGFRPPRVRCADCGVTQVVLPADVLVRRRDATVVVGRAWRHFAAGEGAYRVARLLGLPMETVRGWLRCLRARTRVMFETFGGNGQDHLRWGLAAVTAQAGEAGCHGDLDVWRFVAWRSQGRLLCNTSWP